ncbi:MAG: HAD family hydrolase [Spirochaetia bacterium]|nr:HAD family hydrolase [Spirochaetia bacterium]
MATALLNTILFDLDGTLLPLDQKQFMHNYFALFAKRCNELGYDAERTLPALQKGLGAMLANDGSMTNKERFDQTFEHMSGIPVSEFNTRFASFYEKDFHQLKDASKRSALASSLVSMVHSKGYDVVLATNPLFPWQGTYARLSWAGIDPSFFSLITTYEDFSYAKPHLGYYRQILKNRGVEASRCLMIGNDVGEDLVARQLGMQVYLVTDCLINEEEVSLEPFHKGRLSDLYRFCEELPLCN